MATWVLEREVFADRDEALADAVRSAGGDVVEWSDEWYLSGRYPLLTGRVVFHGALANADQIASDQPWQPGAYCATESFCSSAWWPQAGGELVTEEYALTTVADLVAAGPPAAYGERIFVRPDSPLKPFSGRVLRREDISLAALDHGFYYDDEKLPIVVTPMIEVGAEWRLVVAEGRVVAGSAYAADGRSAGEPISAEHAAWTYGMDVLSRLQLPDPVFVMDVCETPAGLRLLELNPFSGADLYGCDRHAIVDAVHLL